MNQRNLFPQLNLLLLTAIWLSGAGYAEATTIVNGQVSGHWTVAGHPYMVNGHITLSAVDTLVIDPGVEILFNPNTGFLVRGSLIAIGTEEDSILFRSGSSTVGDWSSLQIDGGAAANTRLVNCIIMHAENGIFLTNSNPIIVNCRISNHARSCIRMEGARGEVLNCNLLAAGGNGITIDDNSNTVVRRCFINGCQDNGIAVGGGSTAIIDGATITGTSDHGIYLSSAGTCSLAYNRLFNCGLHGIYIYISNRAVLFRNIAYRCSGTYAVNIYRSTQVQVINNTIYDNNLTGLGSIFSPTEIIDNIVAFNGSDGIYVQGDAPTLNFNDVYANNRNNYSGISASQTDISEDPMLVNPGALDFHPSEGSPVINAGSNRYRDPDGTIADIGAEFFNLNDAPVITRFWPEEAGVVDINSEIEFGVEAEDPNRNPIVYEWYRNGQLLSREAITTISFPNLGREDITVYVDDRLYLGRTSHTWDVTVPVREQTNPNPTEFALDNPYPNPFNSECRFDLTLPAADWITLALYDLCGKEIRMIVSGEYPQGRLSFTLDGAGLPAGAYYLTARAGGKQIQRQIVIIK